MSLSRYLLQHLQSPNSYIEPLHLTASELNNFEEVPAWAWARTRFYTYYWYHDTYDNPYCSNCARDTFPDFAHVAYNSCTFERHSDEIEVDDFFVCELCDKLCISGIQDATRPEDHSFSDNYCLFVKDIVAPQCEE